ncbi:DUF58 domain-containing protein [Candidatus Woesearchaeota archaeon]|nr:MAG: DUF58 domain-containing protein [Candidatus Woesearchaeota archaeon]
MAIKELLVEIGPAWSPADVKAKRRVLSKTLEGSWSTLYKGRGMEFAGYRQYVYGDDASKIDWHATLRAKTTLVREYEEFKTVNVYFLLDVSDSMLFTTQEKLKCEYAAEMLYHFAYAIVDLGDAVGYALFNDDIIASHYPSIGTELLFRLERDLLNGENYGGGIDLKRVLLTVNGMMAERVLFVLISDYLNLPEGWEEYVKMLAVEHDLIGIMVRDPRDHVLSDERLQAIVEDPTTEERLLIDTKQYADLYEMEVTKEEAYIANVFTKARAGFLKMDTTKDALTQLIRYFQKRMRLVRL